MENGREAIRHRSHLRHNVTRHSKTSETKVKFNLPDDDKERKTPNTVVTQPTKPANENGNFPSAEQDASQPDTKTEHTATPVTVGVTTRSKSKLHLPPPESAAPKKGCMKVRKPQ